MNELVGRRYTTDNICALADWSRETEKKHPDLPRGIMDSINEVQSWCDLWIESDPHPANGGDPTVRRGLRPEWTHIHDLYLASRRYVEGLG